MDRERLGWLESISFRGNGGGEFLCIGGISRVVIVDVNSGREIFRKKIHNTRCASLSHDGKRLATFGDDRLIKVWDIATGEEVLSLGLDDRRIVATSDLDFTNDGSQLILCNNGNVHVWDAAPRSSEVSTRTK